jgi:hypothetical protein
VGDRVEVEFLEDMAMDPQITKLLQDIAAGMYDEDFEIVTIVDWGERAEKLLEEEELRT